MILNLHPRPPCFGVDELLPVAVILAGAWPLHAHDEETRLWRVRVFLRDHDCLLLNVQGEKKSQKSRGSGLRGRYRGLGVYTGHPAHSLGISLPYHNLTRPLKDIDATLRTPKGHQEMHHISVATAATSPTSNSKRYPRHEEMRIAIGKVTKTSRSQVTLDTTGGTAGKIT